MKKTALDDEAQIYQKREEQTEKEKWKQMNSREKWQYFVDYYLFKVVVAVIIVGVVGSLIWHFVKPKDETILYVAVIDESLDEKKLADMTAALEKMYQADGKHQKVLIDDSFYMKDGALEKLEVYLESKQVDAIIADEKTFKKMAGYGFFEDAGAFAKENNITGYESSYIYAKGYKDSDEVSFEDNETAKGEKLPYGISLTDAKTYTDMTSYAKKPVFAVAANSQHRENTAKFFEYLMQGK